MTEANSIKILYYEKKSVGFLHALKEDFLVEDTAKLIYTDAAAGKHVYINGKRVKYMLRGEKMWRAAQ